MDHTISFHPVIVRAPQDHTDSGWHVVTPPADSFDPAAVRITPVSQVRSGDTVIGTIQPHYDHLLNPLDCAHWVSYFSHACKPQIVGARAFDAAHCDWCTHNASIGAAGAGCWTVDGCTTYRPDALVLVVPRELV
jgi:hypothetical protein